MGALLRRRAGWPIRDRLRQAEPVSAMPLPVGSSGLAAPPARSGHARLARRRRHRPLGTGTGRRRDAAAEAEGGDDPSKEGKAEAETGPFRAHRGHSRGTAMATASTIRGSKGHAAAEAEGLSPITSD